MTERHFRVVQLDGKKVEFGGVSITSKASPGSAARKLLTSIAHEKGLKKNKKASMSKVKFCIQEYTQGSSKKIYGPYVGHFHKYTAAELKKAKTAGGKIKFTMKPVVKLVKNNKNIMKGGHRGIADPAVLIYNIGCITCFDFNRFDKKEKKGIFDTNRSYNQRGTSRFNLYLAILCLYKNLREFKSINNKNKNSITKSKNDFYDILIYAYHYVYNKNKIGYVYSIDSNNVQILLIDEIDVYYPNDFREKYIFEDKKMLSSNPQIPVRIPDSISTSDKNTSLYYLNEKNHLMKILKKPHPLTENNKGFISLNTHLINKNVKNANIEVGNILFKKNDKWHFDSKINNFSEAKEKLKTLFLHKNKYFDKISRVLIRDFNGTFKYDPYNGGNGYRPQYELYWLHKRSPVMHPYKINYSRNIKHKMDEYTLEKINNLCEKYPEKYYCILSKINNKYKLIYPLFSLEKFKDYTLGIVIKAKQKKSFIFTFNYKNNDNKQIPSIEEVVKLETFFYNFMDNNVMNKNDNEIKIIDDTSTHEEGSILKKNNKNNKNNNWEEIPKLLLILYNNYSRLNRKYEQIIKRWYNFYLNSREQYKYKFGIIINMSSNNQKYTTLFSFEFQEEKKNNIKDLNSLPGYQNLEENLEYLSNQGNFDKIIQGLNMENKQEQQQQWFENILEIKKTSKNNNFDTVVISKNKIKTKYGYLSRKLISGEILFDTTNVNLKNQGKKDWKGWELMF